jgi:hypothetical protein
MLCPLDRTRFGKDFRYVYPDDRPLPQFPGIPEMRPDQNS